RPLRAARRRRRKGGLRASPRAAERATRRRAGHGTESSGSASSPREALCRLLSPIGFQVPEKLLGGFLRKGRLGPVASVIPVQTRRSALREEARSLAAQGEADVVDRGDPILPALTRGDEGGKAPAPERQNEPARLVEPDEAIQGRLHGRRVRHLDEEG